MTPAEAAAEVARLQAATSARRYTRTRLDDYRVQLLALREAGAKNAHIVLWLQTQRPPVKTNGTKVRGWLRRQDEKEDAENGKNESHVESEKTGGANIAKPHTFQAGKTQEPGGP